MMRASPSALLITDMPISHISEHLTKFATSSYAYSLEKF
jgi:hypothetical protein